MAESSFSARKKWWVFLLVCSLLLGIAACRGNNELASVDTAAVPLTAEQAPVGSELRLACSQECADRAQCGTRGNNEQVVLMRRDAPAVSGHDMAVPTGTAITVQESRAENVREITSQQTFIATFLRVSIPSRAEEGWVPLWCLAQ